MLIVYSHVEFYATFIVVLRTIRTVIFFSSFRSDGGALFRHSWLSLF